MGRPHAPFLDRFWSKVRETEDCWLWMGSMRADGYGGFAIKPNLSVGAHRLAWELANALEVPAGMHVLHSCDVTVCVNPAHLRFGTNADNVRDKVQRGRSGMSVQRGSAHPKAKLTEYAVLSIRERYAKGENRAALAREYGVSWDLVYRVCLGRVWRHVGSP